MAIAWWAVGLLALRLPGPLLPTGQWPWFVVEARPNDPTLSCYVDANQTWRCAPDTVLLRDVDNDDSY